MSELESHSETLRSKHLNIHTDGETKVQKGDRLAPSEPMPNPGLGTGLLALQKEDSYCYIHFTKEESEAQKGMETC